MPANKKLLILPGDGIGPEVMREVRRVIDWMAHRRRASFDIEEGLVGGAALDATGSPCPDATVDKARAADAVLFGSVGGPKWDSLPFDKRPELGILRLRKDLGLFANLRPGGGARPAGRRLLAQARPRPRPRPDDRARVDRRHLFRRAARHRDRARRQAARHRHRGLHRGRDRPRRPRRLRPCAQAPEAPHQRREGERHAVRPPLARRGHGDRQGRVPGCRAAAHVRRQLRDAALRPAQAVRRHPRQQPLRRPALRPRGGAHRLARDAALGDARRAGTGRPARTRSTSRSTAPRPTSPARASPTRSRRCSPSPCCCAGPSAWRRTRS